MSCIVMYSAGGQLATMGGKSMYNGELRRWPDRDAGELEVFVDDRIDLSGEDKPGAPITASMQEIARESVTPLVRIEVYLYGSAHQQSEQVKIVAVDRDERDHVRACAIPIR